jgi:diguanylate cyclase (GGDEF)-like protein
MNHMARSETRSNWRSSASTALDAFLYRLSIYGVPVMIALLSLAALVLWEPEYSDHAARPVDFQMLEDRAAALDPRQAGAAISRTPPLRYHDTRLSEVPFWIRFDLLPGLDGRTPALEFPGKHAMDVACWDAAGFSPLGHATRKGAEGLLRQAKAGFVLEFGAAQVPHALLCRVSSVGPARLAVLQWPGRELESSIRKFERNSGLLDGGLIVLSLFVLMIAVINREWMYVLFAAWLVSNLRAGAISAGWDTQWLEHRMPADWVLFSRAVTVSLTYTLTIMLFSRLFKDDLAKVGYHWMLRASQWMSLPLLAAAVCLPFRHFLPVLWGSTALGVLGLTFLLARILFVTRSKVAIWYSVSLAISLFSSLAEVIAAVLGLKELIGTVNSVTAALASSLIAALAIAEQMRQERQQREQAQAELRATYNAIPIGLFTLDTQGGFVRANPALARMLGFDVPDAGNLRWAEHFESGAWARVQDLLRGTPHLEIELQGAAREGREAKRFLVEATLTEDKIEGSLQDVTEKSKATERLHFLAENDSLTGVLNRRGIERVLHAATGNLADGKPLALAYLDLDRFKLINDLYGHGAGDEVLKQVCQRIREMLTAGQDLGRVGGDEFVIVFQGTPIQSAAWTCRGIIDRIGAEAYRLGDTAFQVKGSIGLVEVASSTLVMDAISAADQACRSAKRGQDNGLVVYHKDSNVFAERAAELRLIERLGAPVAPEGLFLEMQPILSLQAPYQSLNFEVLLRMRDDDGSVIGATKIVAAAESNGRIGVIDRWVLSSTLSWLEANYDYLKRTQFVCMNLSGASLNDERFIEDAFAMLAQYVHAAGRLCIEITESVALHDLENTRRFIDGVRGYGAKVALDDFGAGYTSFSYLKELPADLLKIDGSFILGVTGHPANLAIVEAIVSLAKNLGMKCLAEWAEDGETVEALAEVGVDYIQGYAISRPQAPSRILGATSSASFIEDERLAVFVRNLHAADRATVIWEHLGEAKKPGGLH